MTKSYDNVLNALGLHYNHYMNAYVDPCNIIVLRIKNNKGAVEYNSQLKFFENVMDAINYCEQCLNTYSKRYEYMYINATGLYSCVCGQYVRCKSNFGNSRNATDKLVRVKSSNIWSYALDITLGENNGTLYVQFKNKNGGAGDIYQYFNFPVKLWHKFISAPSKGHYFWKTVRNKFRYRKLTGDKTGKLPNAIN